MQIEINEKKMIRNYSNLAIAYDVSLLGENISNKMKNLLF
jgi:hypothetical protein